MRVHLLCDHKWRDLPNLAAIKLRLEQLGRRVLVSSTKDAAPMIASFRPDCVVFNHLFGDVNRALARALRDAGVAIVLLPTEGSTHPAGLSLMAGEFTDYRLADLILNWSEEVSALMRKKWQFDEEVAPTLGCTRFDFYHPRFSGAVTPRDEFCRNYGLDASRPIVTWATKYVLAHLAKPSPEREKFIFESTNFGSRTFFEGLGLKITDIPALEAEGQSATAAAVMKLAAAMPDVQFVLKPHPTESRDFYREKIAEHGLSNVRFCPRDFIWNVLNASDVHLHRYCTTAVEAWMWDKPTIELGMDDVPQLSWEERQQGSDVVRSADELIALVREYLGSRMVDDKLREYRQNYIHKWFGPADGRRCVTAANLIDELLRKRGPARSWFRSLSVPRASARACAGAVIRYALAKLPNEPLVSGKQQAGVSVGPEDKLITRRDVADYAMRVRAAVA